MAEFGRILLTGAAGSLGSHLRTGLAPLCDQLRILDIREMPGARPVRRWLPRLPAAPVRRMRPNSATAQAPAMARASPSARSALSVRFGVRLSVSTISSSTAPVRLARARSKAAAKPAVRSTRSAWRP